MEIVDFPMKHGDVTSFFGMLTTSGTMFFAPQTMEVCWWKYGEIHKHWREKLWKT